MGNNCCQHQKEVNPLSLEVDSARGKRMSYKRNDSELTTAYICTTTCRGFNTTDLEIWPTRANKGQLIRKRRFHVTTIGHLLKNTSKEELVGLTIQQNHITSGLKDVKVNPNSTNDEAIQKLWEDTAYHTKVHKWNNFRELQFHVNSKLISTLALKTLGFELSKQMSSLRKLSLTFKWCSNIDGNGLRILAHNISKYLRNLRYLTIDFNGTDLYEGDILNFISSLSLSKFKSLEHFELDLKGTALTDAVIRRLANYLIPQLGKLKHLGLFLKSGYIITDEGFRNLITNIGTHLQQLVTFRLSFHLYQDFAENEAFDLSNQLRRNFRKLQKLSLDFSHSLKLSDEGVINLVSSLQYSGVKLSHFSLDFGACTELTDQALEAVSLYIKSKSKTLTELFLNFENCMLIQDVKLLANSIKECSQLKLLKLDFENCTRISDEGVEAITNEIGTTLKLLQILRLDFSGCWQLTDNSIINLATHLGKLPKSLSYLNLSFKKIAHITEMGCETLFAQIKDNHKNLKFLCMKFSKCVLTEKGIQELSAMIEQIYRCLGSLDLYFNGFIRSSSFEAFLVQILENHDNLHSLSLKTFIRDEDEKVLECIEKLTGLIPICEIS